MFDNNIFSEFLLIIQGQLEKLETHHLKWIHEYETTKKCFNKSIKDLKSLSESKSFLFNNITRTSSFFVNIYLSLRFVKYQLSSSFHAFSRVSYCRIFLIKCTIAANKQVFETFFMVNSRHFGSY